MQSWYLAIDFGTTSTCAVTVSTEGTRVVTFGPDALRRMPSAVLARPDGGLAVGFEAERLAALHADCYDPAPKRSIGRATLPLGSADVPVVVAVAAVLKAVADEAREQRGGAPPAAVCLTVPARWSQHRQAALRDAASRAGLGDVRMISEPEAAALHYARTDRLEPGAVVAIYDLGGGTFDTAVLRRTPDGFAFAGAPGGIDPFGGEDLDARLTASVLGAVAAERPERRWTASERWQLRRQVRQAKEELSTSERTEVVLPDGSGHPLTRQDLRAAAGGDIDVTVAELQRTVTRAGLTPEALDAIYLAGGSSRLPLVRESLLRAWGPRTEALVRTLDDPKLAIALGAAAHLHWTDNQAAPTTSPITFGAPPAKRSTRVAVAVIAAAAVVAGGWAVVHGITARKTDVVHGVVLDSRGLPLANAALTITGTAKPVHTRTTAAGTYSTKLPGNPDGVQISAVVYVAYHHRTFGLSLTCAHDPSCNVVTLPADGGVEVDWRLQISGRPADDGDSSSTDGRSVGLRPSDRVDDSLQAGQSAVVGLSEIPSDLPVTITLSPNGALVDGSPARVRQFETTAGALGDYSGVALDVALGDYTLTATLHVNGNDIPLVLSTGQGQWSQTLAVPLEPLAYEGVSAAIVYVGLPAADLN